MSGTGDAGRRVVITYAATPPMPRVTDEEDAPRSVEPDTVLATSPALLSGESPSSPVVVQDRRFVGPLPVICAMDTAAVAGATSGALRWATPSRAKVMPAAPARVQGGTVTVVEHAAGCDKSSASASASTSTQLSRGKLGAGDRCYLAVVFFNVPIEDGGDVLGLCEWCVWEVTLPRGVHCCLAGRFLEFRFRRVPVTTSLPSDIFLSCPPATWFSLICVLPSVLAACLLTQVCPHPTCSSRINQQCCGSSTRLYRRTRAYPST